MLKIFDAGLPSLRAEFSFVTLTFNWPYTTVPFFFFRSLRPLIFWYEDSKNTLQQNKNADLSKLKTQADGN